MVNHKANIEAIRIFNQYFVLLFDSELDKGHEIEIGKIAKQCVLTNINNTLKEASVKHVTHGREGISNYCFCLRVKSQIHKL